MHISYVCNCHARQPTWVCIIDAHIVADMYWFRHVPKANMDGALAGLYINRTVEKDSTKTIGTYERFHSIEFMIHVMSYMLDYVQHQRGKTDLKTKDDFHYESGRFDVGVLELLRVTWVRYASMLLVQCLTYRYNRSFISIVKMH